MNQNKIALILTSPTTEKARLAKLKERCEGVFSFIYW
jgi:hypothetical protein